MSMELLSMDHWNIFYDKDKDLKRAKLEQLEKALGTLPWVAAIDKFQHWIYTTEHTAKERREKWIEIDGSLGNQVIDWEGQESSHAIMWQRQLHLYEVPFYYIEYGMAQLGAIAIWREYIINGEEAIDKYIEGINTISKLPSKQLIVDAVYKCLNNKYSNHHIHIIIKNIEESYQRSIVEIKELNNYINNS